MGIAGYFQLILHLLQINDIEKNTSLNKTNVNSDWIQVYQEGFKINFIEQDIKEYIDTLHATFDSSDLRTKIQLDYDIEDAKKKLNALFEQNEWADIFKYVEKSALKYDKTIFERLRREVMIEGVTNEFIEKLSLFIQSLS